MQHCSYLGYLHYIKFLKQTVSFAGLCSTSEVMIACMYYVVGVNFNWVVKNVNGSWYKVCRRWKKNEMRDSFHICLIFLLAGCLLACLDFCDNGVLRSDKAKIRQISPSSLFFDVSICTLSRQRYPIQKSKKSKCYFFFYSWLIPCGVSGPSKGW